jgi:pimeloyl-ACP methyl ester carboxylesterase
VVTALLLWVVRLSPAVGLDVDQVDRDPAVGEQDRGGGAREAAADRLQLLDGQLLAATWGFEVRPNEFDVAFQPLHQVAIPHITMPFLIAHGENDRQIPLEYAHRSYDQAVNSPKRKLRVFTPEEGATEHIGLDHLLHVSAYVADWIADTFAELAASKS